MDRRQTDLRGQPAAAGREHAPIEAVPDGKAVPDFAISSGLSSALLALGLAATVTFSSKI